MTVGTEVPWIVAATLVAGTLVMRRDVAWKVTAIVAIAHAAWVASLGVFPIPLDSPAGDPGWRESVNLVPLRTIAAAIDAGPGSPAFLQALQNAFILLPAGIAVPILTGARLTTGTFVATAIGAGASLELAQAAISFAIAHPYRRLDVDDVILNTIGVAVGLAIVTMAHRMKNGRAPEGTRPARAAKERMPTR